MRKVLIYVFLMAVALALMPGCSKTEKSTLCTLKSYTATNGTGTSSTTYGYQGSRLIGETMIAGGQTTVTTYIYDSLGNIGVSSASTNGVPLVTIYLYDSINRLKRRVVEDNVPVTIDYAYNEHGQLITATFTAGSGGPPTQVVTYQYPDIVTRNPATVTPVGGLSTAMTYDNKIYPFRGFLSSIQHSNNVTQYVGDISISISYQYNSAGYPVSATWTNGDTETWTYDCVEI